MIRTPLVLAMLASCTSEPVDDDKPAPTYPTGFTFESISGSLASFGWSGQVHDRIEPDGTPFGVTTTTCQGEVCQFQGPTDPGGPVNRRRCLFHTRTTCTTDIDCPKVDGASTPCVFIYDTPVAQPIVDVEGNEGVCAWSYIPLGTAEQPTISGTINLTTGALNLAKLTVLLPLNAAPKTGTFHGACMECVGDPTPNDGIPQGKCQPATHLGSQSTHPGPDVNLDDLDKPCDANRVSKLKDYAGNYSMDCSPTVHRSPLPPLAFGGSFSSSGAKVTLDDHGPKCSDGQLCFCGTCESSAQACMSDSECGDARCVNPTVESCDPWEPGQPQAVPPYVPHQCKKNRLKFAVYSNSCPDGDCDWNNDTGMGRCHKNAEIACYPNKGSITVAGHHERDDHVGTVYRVSTGAASCIPLSDINPGLNFQLGLPGMLFQKRNFQIIPKYEAQP